MAGNCDVIEKLEREWRDALCSKDMQRLAEMTHPDFVLIGTRSSGPFVMHREEWLDAIQRRDLETIDFEIQDASVFDDVMIGTVRACWKLKYLGRVIEDCVVSTDVWVKEGGRWVSIRRHSTPAPAPAGAGTSKGK